MDDIRRMLRELGAARRGLAMRTQVPDPDPDKEDFAERLARRIKADERQRLIDELLFEKHCGGEPDVFPLLTRIEVQTTMILRGHN